MFWTISEKLTYVEYIQNSPGYDDGVEPVEGVVEERPDAQRVHPDDHLQDEHAQEQELGVHCACAKQ